MKWALIGASQIASNWMVGAIRAVGDEIVGVISGSAEHGQAFAQQHGIAHADTRLEALRDWGAEAVYVSSTNDKHEAQTLAAARLGLHVLCEKPLATSLDAAKRMAQACQDAGVTMGTNHHLRHNAAHQAMRAAVAAGELGEVVAARAMHSVYLRQDLQTWRLNNVAAGGGVVLDIAVHNADSVAFVLGEYPLAVTAMVSSSGMGQGLEDNAMSVWHMPSGATVSAHQGFNTPYAPAGLEVHGTRGSMLGRGVMNQGPDGVLLQLDAGGERAIELPRYNLYERVLRHFHLARQGQAHDLADGWAGVRSLQVALAILESAQTGRTVELAP